MIREVLLPILTERFPGLFTVAGVGTEPFVTFPAKHPDVGAVELYDDCDEITLFAGKFTHGHFSNYEDLSTVEREKKIAEDVARFLEQLFSDQVILWGSHQCCGGWKVIPPTGPQRYRRKEYVWSGPTIAPPETGKLGPDHDAGRKTKRRSEIHPGFLRLLARAMRRLGF